jgi:sulfotransferase family protein
MPTSPPSAGEPQQSPIFILTTSRSGSTLLRFILDSHTDIACPPESGTPAALVGLARLWGVLQDTETNGGLVHPAPLPSARATAALRAAVDDVFGEYLRARGKVRWCDKSLDAFQTTDLISHVFPDARFIVLTRHCMDVIASGVEVCPWGVSRFGFDPFVAQYPGNSVAAIGGYWLACTQANLAFAQAHPDSCHLVRYEDLVTAPEETAAALLSFLGAAPAPGITRAAFATPHDAGGAGDEKIWFTSSVSGHSVGRGVIVPANALPPPMRQMINEALAKLKYRTVEEDWNLASSPLDPRVDVPAAAGDTGRGDGTAPDSEIQPAVTAITERLAARSQAELDAIAASWPATRGTTVRLVVRADGGEQTITWQSAVDGAASAGSAANGEDIDQGEASSQSATVIAAPATWQALLGGQANLVTEISTGRVRVVNRRDGHRLRSDEVHATAALLGLATIPVRTGTGKPAQPQPAP